MNTRIEAHATIVAFKLSGTMTDSHIDAVNSSMVDVVATGTALIHSKVNYFSNPLIKCHSISESG